MRKNRLASSGPLLAPLVAAGRSTGTAEGIHTEALYPSNSTMMFCYSLQGLHRETNRQMLGLPCLDTTGCSPLSARLPAKFPPGNTVASMAIVFATLGKMRSMAHMGEALYSSHTRTEFGTVRLSHSIEVPTCRNLDLFPNWKLDIEKIEKELIPSRHAFA